MGFRGTVSGNQGYRWKFDKSCLAGQLPVLHTKRDYDIKHSSVAVQILKKVAFVKIQRQCLLYFQCPIPLSFSVVL